MTDKMGRIMPVEKQLEEWVKGNPIHNGKDKSSGECCPDFSCCGGDLAPLEVRELFVKAKEPLRTRMLMEFLEKMLAKQLPDKKVYIAGLETSRQEL